MNVHVTSRHTPLSPEIKAYCDKRFAALAKLTTFVTDADVILSAERNRPRVEIHIKAKGAGLVIVEDSPDIWLSLGRAFDGLEKKLKKEREKFREKKRRGGRERKSLSVPSTEPADSRPRIVRSGLYESKPMSIEEAAIAFDVAKKDVLMFRLNDSERWAVLYRRKDGDIGLVEPE